MMKRDFQWLWITENLCVYECVCVYTRMCVLANACVKVDVILVFPFWEKGREIYEA